MLPTLAGGFFTTSATERPFHVLASPSLPTPHKKALFKLQEAFAVNFYDDEKL